MLNQIACLIMIAFLGGPFIAMAWDAYTDIRGE